MQPQMYVLYDDSKKSWLVVGATSLSHVTTNRTMAMEMSRDDWMAILSPEVFTRGFALVKSEDSK